MIKIIRWILVLPTALLAVCLFEFIYGMIFGTWLSHHLKINNYLEIVNMFIYTYAFVYIGAKAAPNHKKLTALVLSVIYIFFSYYGLFVGQYKQYGQVTPFAFNIMYGVSQMIAVIMSYLNIASEDRKRELMKIDVGELVESYDD